MSARAHCDPPYFDIIEDSYESHSMVVSTDTCDVRSRFTIGHEHKAHVPKCSKLGSEGGNRIGRVELPYIPLPEVIAHVFNAKMWYLCLTINGLYAVP